MTREEAEARDRLLFHLENQTGFWFALVIGDDPRPRTRLREETERFCREHGQPFHLHIRRPHELVGLAVDLAKGDRPGLHWIRCDGSLGLIDQWNTAASELFRAMNERREAYRKRLDGGVVIEGRESLKRRLRDLAPDLFSIRAFIAEIGISLGAEKPLIPEWHEPKFSFLSFVSVVTDPDRELARAARLAAVDGPGARRAGAKALLAGVFGLLLTGRLHEAERRSDDLASQADRLLGETPKDVATKKFLIFVRLVQGLISAASRRDEQAMRFLNEALSMLGSLFDDAPNDQSLLDLLVLREILSARGRVLSNQGDVRGSVDSLRRSLDIARVLAENNKSNQELQIELVSASMSLAHVLRQGRDLSSAESLLREAVAREEQHTAEHPTENLWRHELMRCRRELGEVLAARGDLAGALEESRSALHIAEELTENEASDERLHLELWWSNQRVVATHAALGDWSEALISAAQGHSVAERGWERPWDRQRWGWILALSHAQQGEIMRAKGDMVEAKAALLRAWLQASRLPVRPLDARAAGAIAQMHMEMGDTEIERGNLIWATSFFKRAVKLAERVTSVMPRDSVARWSLAMAYRWLAFTLKFRSKRRASIRFRRKANRLLKRRVH